MSALRPGPVRAPGDGLSWLLAGLSATESDRARALVTFARLLHADARGWAAEAVGSGPADALQALARVRRTRALDAVEALLQHVLAASMPADGFLDPGRPALGYRAAWGVLADLARAGARVPGVPAPREGPRRLSRRLLRAAARLGACARWLAAWEARRAHALEGPSRAVARWRAALGQAAGTAASDEALVGCLRAMLERGRVHAARRLVRDALAPRRRGGASGLAADPASLELVRWEARLALLVGELPDAAPPPASRAPLPPSLGELCLRVPAWAPWLVGGPPVRGRPPRERAHAARERFGAQAIAVFLRTRAGGVRCVARDLAPGLEGAWLEHRRARGWAIHRRGTPEERVVSTGRAWLRHRPGVAPLEGALEPRRARALALVPLAPRARGSAAAGWIHLEAPHALLPAAARLASWAAAWDRRLATDPA